MIDGPKALLAHELVLTTLKYLCTQFYVVTMNQGTKFDLKQLISLPVTVLHLIRLGILIGLGVQRLFRIILNPAGLFRGVILLRFSLFKDNYCVGHSVEHRGKGFLSLDRIVLFDVRLREGKPDGLHHKYEQDHHC